MSDDGGEGAVKRTSFGTSGARRQADSGGWLFRTAAAEVDAHLSAGTSVIVEAAFARRTLGIGLDVRAEDDAAVLLLLEARA